MNASTLNQGTDQDPPCPLGPTAGHVVDGVIFLRRQQASLSRRIQDFDATVRAGTTAEEAATHAEWLALIAAVSDARGSEAAYRVTRLYEYHGRVLGSLDRQRTLPLSPPAAQGLRRMLADHLVELTTDAVDAVCPRHPR